MPATGTSLLSLPDEILVEILRPLLQHSTATTKTSRSLLTTASLADWFDEEFPGPIIFDSMFTNVSDRLSAQILRTCKRLNVIGTPLLYENTLIFHTPPPDFDRTSWGIVVGLNDAEGAELTLIKEQLRRFSNAKRSDHGEMDGLLKKLVLVIHTDDTGYPDYDELNLGAQLVRYYLSVLAEYRKCWEKVAVVVVDGTTNAIYARYEHTAIVLLQHCGLLYAKHALVVGVNDTVTEEIQWCLEQPQHVEPRNLAHFEGNHIVYDGD